MLEGENVGRLRSLSLFLLFKDPPTQHYVVENENVIVAVLALFLMMWLPLAAVMFWLFQVSIFAFFAGYIFLSYALIQALHVYDYLRARR